MNATCQVAYAANGRIRLEIPSIRRQPKIAEVLVPICSNGPGVTGVQTLHSSGSLVIRYDPRLCTQHSILQVVGLRQLADPDGQPTPHVTPAPAPKPPYDDCQVRHELPARARLHVPIIKTQSTYAERAGQLPEPAGWASHTYA